MKKDGKAQEQAEKNRKYSSPALPYVTWDRKRHNV